MPLDPQIPLSVQTPAPISPLQTIGGLMQLRDQASQVALRNAQTQQAQQQAADLQAQAQQRQRTLQSISSLQTVLKDPDAHTKFAQGDFSPIWNAGVDPTVANDAITKLQGMQEKAQTLATGKAAFYAGGRDQLAKTIEGLDPTDDAKAAEQWNASLPILASEHPELAGQLPRLAADSNLRDQLSNIAASNGIARAILQNKADLEGKQATTAKTNAEMKESLAKKALEEAQTPGATAESDLKVAQAAALKNLTPQTIGDQVDKELNPASYKDPKIAAQVAIENGNAKTAALAAVPQGLGAVQAAIKDSVDRVGRLSAGVASAQAQVPVKIDVARGSEQARADVATPSGAGLDMMAEAALNGQAPTSRNPILVKKIWDRAAEIAQEHGLSATQALMQRNSAQAARGALNSVTKQYETLKPFADMAEKNADILEKAIGGVSNLGASVLNTPLRELESKFTGNTDVAKFKAAILPVQADFARILNSPTGGGVLSDSARHEMEQAIKPGATPGEMKAALDIFRQDAKNRREAYESNIRDLTGRSVAGGETPPPTAPPSTPKATHRYNPQTGKIEPIQ